MAAAVRVLIYLSNQTEGNSGNYYNLFTTGGIHED